MATSTNSSEIGCYTLRSTAFVDQLTSDNTELIALAPCARRCLAEGIPVFGVSSRVCACATYLPTGDARVPIDSCRAACPGGGESLCTISPFIYNLHWVNYTSSELTPPPSAAPTSPPRSPIDSHNSKGFPIWIPAVIVPIVTILAIGSWLGFFCWSRRKRRQQQDRETVRRRSTRQWDGSTGIAYAKPRPDSDYGEKRLAGAAPNGDRRQATTPETVVVDDLSIGPAPQYEAFASPQIGMPASTSSTIFRQSPDHIDQLPLPAAALTGAERRRSFPLAEIFSTGKRDTSRPPTAKTKKHSYGMGDNEVESDEDRPIRGRAQPDSNTCSHRQRTRSDNVRSTMPLATTSDSSSRKRLRRPRFGHTYSLSDSEVRHDSTDRISRHMSMGEDGSRGFHAISHDVPEGALIDFSPQGNAPAPIHNAHPTIASPAPAVTTERRPNGARRSLTWHSPSRARNSNTASSSYTNVMHYLHPEASFSATSSSAMLDPSGGSSDYHDQHSAYHSSHSTPPGSPDLGLLAHGAMLCRVPTMKVVNEDPPTELAEERLGITIDHDADRKRAEASDDAQARAQARGWVGRTFAGPGTTISAYERPLDSAATLSVYSQASETPSPTVARNSYFAESIAPQPQSPTSLSLPLSINPAHQQQENPFPGYSHPPYFTSPAATVCPDSTPPWQQQNFDLPYRDVDHASLASQSTGSPAYPIHGMRLQRLNSVGSFGSSVAMGANGLWVTNPDSARRSPRPSLASEDSQSRSSTAVEEEYMARAY